MRQIHPDTGQTIPFALIKTCDPEFLSGTGYNKNGYVEVILLEPGYPIPIRFLFGE
jgi:hypothetical protein